MSKLNSRKAKNRKVPQAAKRKRLTQNEIRNKAKSFREDIEARSGQEGKAALTIVDKGEDEYRFEVSKRLDDPKYDVEATANLDKDGRLVLEKDNTRKWNPEGIEKNDRVFVKGDEKSGIDGYTAFVVKITPPRFSQSASAVIIDGKTGEKEEVNLNQLIQDNSNTLPRRRK